MEERKNGMMEERAQFFKQEYWRESNIPTFHHSNIPNFLWKQIITESMNMLWDTLLLRFKPEFLDQVSARRHFQKKGSTEIFAVG